MAKAGGWSADLFKSTVLLGLFAACLFMNVVDGQIRDSPHGTAAATINVRNQCSQTITACSTCGSCSTDCYVLAGGNSGQKLLDVGSSWAGGLIWGFPGSGSVQNGIDAKPQADLAEFTIGSNGQDSYDISLVNAYNLGLTINPTTIAGGGTRSGLTCGTPTCTISNALTGFCQSPNTLTGAPGNGCYNTDGPGTASTGGTQAFGNACPDAYSYSTDNANHVYGCNTGSDYEVVFCP